MTILEMETQIDVLKNQVLHYRNKCNTLTTRNGQLLRDNQNLRTEVNYHKSLKQVEAEAEAALQAFIPIYA